jgi:hypothetical protein
MLTSKGAFHDTAPPLAKRLGVFLVVTIFIASQFSQSKTGTEMTLKELIPLLRFFKGAEQAAQQSCLTKCVMGFLLQHGWFWEKKQDVLE